MILFISISLLPNAAMAKGTTVWIGPIDMHAATGTFAVTPTPIPTADSATVSLNTGALESATPQKYLEMETRIVLVRDNVVFFDKGAADGIEKDQPLLLYDAIVIQDATGTATTTEKIKIGELRAETVEEHFSSAIVMSAARPPETGMFVRWYVAAPDTAILTPLTNPALLQKTKCPAGMQIVLGGAFTYTPGSPSREIPIGKESVTEQSDNFCVDVWPQKEPLNWSEAFAACSAVGKQLCTRVEQHRTCQTHNRKPPCKQMDDPAQCSRGEAVEDFTGMQEWSAAWTEDSAEVQGEKNSRQGSCSCTGSTSSCMVCFYPECRGVKKKFRCCKEPE